MKKKIVSLLLCLSIMLAWLPITALTAGTSYDLWVGGVQVTSENASNITGTDINGTVSYDAATHTLTLDNATVGAYEFSTFWHDTSCIFSENELIIKLVGNNTLTGIDQGGSSYGVYIDNEGLTFTGNGSLTVTAADISSNKWSVAVFAEGSITVEEGCTITACCGDSDWVTQAFYSYAHDNEYVLPNVPGILVAGNKHTADATKIEICNGNADGFKYLKIAPGYTVTLNTNEGTINSGNVTCYFVDAGAALPIDVTKSGCSFDGWYDNSGLTGEAVTSIPANATGNKEYWAKWTSASYTVVFDANGGTGTMAAANNISGNYTLPPNGFTAPAGKQFKCWSVNDIEKNPFESISVTENVTVKAMWKDIAASTYTVSFDSNGGSGTMASVTNAPSLYMLPSNGFTAPAGKQFKCWAVGALGDEYDPGDTIAITSNITVKAVWETITSSRQVISDIVATSSDLDTIPTLYGLLKIPEFTVTQGSPAYITASTSNLRWQKNIGGVWTNQDTGRFTPGEWRISSSLRIDGTDAHHYELGNPTTLTVNGHAWTVENNGKPSVHPGYSHANIVSPTFTIVDDPNVQPPISVPSVHMILKGYQVGEQISAATVETDAMVNAEVLGFLKAVDTNGDGQPDNNQEATGVFEENEIYAIVISLRAKNGYDISGLTGQTVSLDRSFVDMAEGHGENETFSGLYLLDDIVQYTVTFETNGGSAIDPMKVTRGRTLVLPANPTRAYYAFAGWYEDEALTQAFDSNSSITADTILYAKWTPSPVGGMFLMTFDFNGGTSTMASSGEVEAGSCIYLNPNIEGVVIPPSGKVFAGYEIDGVPYSPGDEYLVTQNFTLKFLWEDAPPEHTCDIQPVDKVNPSCTEGGKEAYYQCEDCGKYYEDEQGAVEITDIDAWGNLENLGHTESEWMWDEENHWKECTVADCGVIIEDSEGAHADADEDGYCDVCECEVCAGNNNDLEEDDRLPDGEGPEGDAQGPETGDNSIVWLWIALMLVSGALLVTTACSRKRRTANR